MTNPPHPHIFGVWEETGEPGGNPRRHKENAQTPYRQYFFTLINIRIESLQCRRPFSPLSLHWPQSHPAPIPVTPYTYPANPPDTKGQFSMANPPNPHIFGLWEETGEPGGNPRRHGENVQTPHRQWPEAEIEPGSLVLWGSSANHCATVLPFLAMNVMW